MSREIFRRVHELHRASMRRFDAPTPGYDQLEDGARARFDAFVARCLSSYHRGSFAESPIEGARMTWSISASGTKDVALANLEKYGTEYATPAADAADHIPFHAALAHAKALVESAPADATVSCSASGHSDSPAVDQSTSYTSFSFNSVRPKKE